jgi:5-methylcytosine-specific restriction enzyme subunit McrC
MKSITLFEHEFRAFSDLPYKSEDQVWESLDAFNIHTGLELISIERKGIRANEYVGVIRVGDITFQVLPKIDNGGSNALPGSILYHHATSFAACNLLYMLSYAFDLDLTAQDLAHLDTGRTTWFEVLTRLFATGLHRQIQAGIAQNYISISETLPVLRGRWDINYQLLHHPFSLNTFDVIYDEFSPNIPINKIFKYVIDQLIVITEDDQNRTQLLDLREWFFSVRLEPDIPSTLVDQITFTRLNERFEPAFNLARLFLSGKSAQLTVGRYNTYAFMLDMNNLFEQFLTQFLIKFQKQILPPSWEDVQIRPKAKGINYYLAERLPDESRFIRLQPDLLFTQLGSNMPVLIADAKYKRIAMSKSGLNISEADLYQMLAYTTRFDCLKVILIYPQGTSPINQSFKLVNTNVVLYIHTVNLHQPLSDKNSIIQELRSMFVPLS